jgi:hypothetical protein
MNITGNNPSDFKDLCDRKVTGGPLIEVLARYGDATFL